MSSLIQAATSLGAAASAIRKKSDADLQREALLAADKSYDPAEQLIWGKSSDNRYHTQLSAGTDVHPTRESAEYAVSLLESDEPWRRERGAAIITKLLGLQDTNRENSTFGIWSWYYEEPLPQMAPPDWNWADFIGTQFLRVLRNQGPDELGRELHSGMLQSLGFAAESIRKRDVTLSYTNIAIMGTYVALMAGHLLNDTAMLAYARDRLRRFVAFTAEFGGFPEYNSPTYTTVGIAELTRMLRDFPTEEDRELARVVHDRAWQEIARHWHAPSRQWAGPHSRCYSTLLAPGTLGFIQRGLGDRATVLPEGTELPALSLDVASLPLRCPDSLIPSFRNAAPRAHVVLGITRGDVRLEGHTHLTPSFALSSAERGPFWNQARALSAYAPGSSAFALRFLHDDYDFSAANLLTRQHEAKIIGAVSIAHDGGDKHPSLDKFPGGRISARDWRLRLEFINPVDTGTLEKLTLDTLDLASGESAWRIPFGPNATLCWKWLHFSYGDLKPHLEITAAQGKADRSGSRPRIINVDVVFYTGERKEFHFAADFPASIAFALEILENDEAEMKENLAGASAVLQNQSIALAWPAAGAMTLTSPLYPKAEAEIIAWALSRNDSGRSGLVAQKLEPARRRG